MFCFRMGLFCNKLSVLLVIMGLVGDLTTAVSPRPNIVFFIADDLGWDDVSFHGSEQVLTPNIDLLASGGAALARHYAHALCTPSRSALLTGKYAHTIGMHGYPLTNSEDRGIPLSEKLLPEYLKDLGYATHLVGKWHVGGARNAYLPTSRGFDTYFGHVGGFIDYYEYVNEERWPTGLESGLDMLRNTTPAWDVEGYITDVYNEEAKSIIKAHDKSKPLYLMVASNAPHAGNEGSILQAPPEEVRKMRHVESPNRRIYSAMVKKLDDSIGDIVSSLFDRGMLDNTIVVFIGDNGGMTSGASMNYGSNWPLRGLKFSPFEGGVRTLGLIWSPALNNTNYVWKGYMHISDWLPTLLRAAGSDPPAGIDGHDLWESILSNVNSDRDEMFEFDNFFGYSSITSGDYKLITGNVKKSYCNHQGGDIRGVVGTGPSYIDTIRKSKMYSVLERMGKKFKIEDVDVIRNNIRVQCRHAVAEDELCYPDDNGKVCLFNIKEDPCELRDVSLEQPETVQRLLTRLAAERPRVMPRPAVARDPRAKPRLFNHTWTTWADHIPNDSTFHSSCEL